MPDEYGKAAFDMHAELKNDLARLNEEVLVLALAGLGLAIALTLISWKLWHAQ